MEHNLTFEQFSKLYNLVSKWEFGEIKKYIEEHNIPIPKNSRIDIGCIVCKKCESCNCDCSVDMQLDIIESVFNNIILTNKPMNHEKITLFGKEYYLVPVDAQSEEITGDKYDNLRKLIGRYGVNLCIFGEKTLQSVKYGNATSIQYDNVNREYFNNLVNFEETTLDKLEYGDVFVFEYQTHTDDYEFCFIFLGRDDTLEYVCQNIGGCHGIESISTHYFGNSKVTKALRN